MRIVLGSAVVIVVLAAGWPAVLMATLAALVASLFGPLRAMQALFAIVVIKFLHDGIYSFPMYFGVLAWLVLFAAAARSITAIARLGAGVMVSLWSFVLVVAVLTFFNTTNATLSLFKLVSFAIGASCVVATALSLKSHQVHKLRTWMPSVGLGVALVTVLTLPFPGVSESKVPGSLQGILGHPQTLGAFFAPLVALIVARFLFRRRDFRRVDGMLFVLVAALMLASDTRTAAIAVSLGILSAMFAGVWRERDARKEALRSWFLGIGLGFLALTAILVVGPLREAVSEFVFKRGAGESVEEAFMASRGEGIEAQWANFVTRPLIGNGFGIYPGSAFGQKPVMFLGLPISAPVEKGFLPTAILEEVGILGTIPFLVLIACIVRRTFATGDQVWFAVAMTCVFVNIGEAVFFSMGGLGLMFWLWLGVAMRGTEPLASERLVRGSKDRSLRKNENAPIQ